jgi:thermostable 8-oxoguanine DNA glycosylase
LVANGINKAADVTSDNADAVKRIVRGVPGIGIATANYFLMLLGFHDEAKPDSMILRFIRRCLGRSVTPEEAVRLLKAVAESLGVVATQLDHALWKYESGRAARGE